MRSWCATCTCACRADHSSARHSTRRSRKAASAFQWSAHKGKEDRNKVYVLSQYSSTISNLSIIGSIISMVCRSVLEQCPNRGFLTSHTCKFFDCKIAVPSHQFLGRPPTSKPFSCSFLRRVCFLATFSQN